MAGPHRCAPPAAFGHWNTARRRFDRWAKAGAWRRFEAPAHVGTPKGVGRVYQRTFIATYGEVGFAELDDRKTPITAADLLNDRVVPFHDEHGPPLQRIPTDRGTGYCGGHDRHEYELHLAVENIDHSRTETKSPRTNGIVERFHETIPGEFYRIALRKKVDDGIEGLQADLDAWMAEYNQARAHQARYRFGRQGHSILAPRR